MQFYVRSPLQVSFISFAVSELLICLSFSHDLWESESLFTHMNSPKSLQHSQRLHAYFSRLANVVTYYGRDLLRERRCWFSVRAMLPRRAGMCLMNLYTSILQGPPFPSRLHAPDAPYILYTSKMSFPPRH